MTTALVLIDIQNDYFPGGANPLFGSDLAVTKAAAMLQYFRTHHLPVIHIQHIAATSSATFFLPGTAGADIHPAVAPRAGETVFIKHFPNSFRDTGLLDHLRQSGIAELVIVGMMTHMCIDTTVRAARDLGFNNTVIGDATATLALELAGKQVAAEHVQQAFLAALHPGFAQVVTTADWLESQ